MRILLSAIACHPAHGSEASVGWKAAAALSKHHDVHVLTSSGEREGIERVLSRGDHPNLSFTYFGASTPYHANRLIARLQSWMRYVNWCQASLKFAESLAVRRSFDLAHHVTYSTWRVAPPLWRLNLPFVWGPVGGAAEFPPHLLHKLSLHASLFEVVRALSNLKASRSPALRTCARKSAAVIASNSETFNKLAGLRGTTEGLHEIFPTFFTTQQVGALKCDPSQKPAIGPLRLFSGGNIIGSKGLIFALEALASISRKGIQWRLIIGGHGSEIPFLQQQARRLGIRDHIEFHTGFAGDEYIDKLKEAHVFILPSFRENAGITMLEAMLAGCTPVIVDASAQGGVVNESCGFKIPVGSAADISKGLASALCLLTEQPQRRIEMGRAASELVAASFREDSYLSNINKVYADALQQRRDKSAR